MAAALKASIKILVLLALLVFSQDFFRVPTTVGWRIRVDDADVEHGGGTPFPETAGGDIATVFWREL